MNDPEPLIHDFLEDRLDETGQAALRAWIKQDPSHLRRFTGAVMFDQEIRAVVHAREGSRPASGIRGTFPQRDENALAPSSPVPFPHPAKTPGYFARAAAWFGAFSWFSHQAEAATAASAAKSTSLLTHASRIILMKKTITSITAAILVLGGAGIYAIHHNNESSRARVEFMETEIQSLSTQLGLKTTSSAEGRTSNTSAPRPVAIGQVVAMWAGVKNNRLTRKDSEILGQFSEQLTTMDAESLKDLLLDAERISSPIHGSLVTDIMKELISKDPAMATQVAAQLNGRGPAFQFQLAHAAADAFSAWLAKDPAAADAWYIATAAAGALDSKNIPESGLESLAIDRSFARLRFAAQVKTNPAEAAAMLATMPPDDATSALQQVTGPDALRQILPRLAPAQQGPAAEGAIKAMAATDLNAAFTWAGSLALDARMRDALMATGIEAAVASRKLDLPGVSEWAKGLNLDPERRSDLLVSAATSVSLIPQQREHSIDPNHSVVWDRVAERIDWLRKEAPADSAGKTVGEYLGKLSYRSHNLEKSLEAYQNEVSRQGKIDPDLTTAFAFHLQMQDKDSAKTAALDLLNKLPPSEKRDHLIKQIQINR